MDLTQILSKILTSFEHYYTIKTDDVTAPFDAEAEFISHSEQYMLVKIAKIADIDSNDFAYFKTAQVLTLEDVKNYAKTAWENGIARVKPYYGHRNTDVTLLIVAERFEDSVGKQIKKLKYSKSYKHGFWGWSNFRLATLELSSGKIYCNRLGTEFKKILQKVDNTDFQKEENHK